MITDVGGPTLFATLFLHSVWGRFGSFHFSQLSERKYARGHVDLQDF